MAAEADFFFKMGFLVMKEDAWDKRLGGGEVLCSD
jgi:hypothetical protein